MSWRERLSRAAKRAGFTVASATTEGNTIHVHFEQDMDQEPHILVFPDDTRIRIGSGNEPRETLPGEEFFVKQFFSVDGMTTGDLLDGTYFKALDEPLDIRNFKEIPKDPSTS